MSKIILSAPKKKEIEDHRQALKKAGLKEGHFWALRGCFDPTDPDTLVEMRSLGLISANGWSTEQATERLDAYWQARRYTPKHSIVDIVWD